VRFISVNKDRYVVLGTVSVETGYTTQQLKDMYTLADTVLRNGREYFICMKIIEAEFDDL
tara:strand:+ start:73 stop:252 length:180 start_codon:yes stop_codon:yes gene_type:complete